MADGRDTMIGMGVSAPALGAGVAERSRAPDPEIVAKPTRRRFTAAYKLRILEETDGCSEPGEVGRIVRREGLYSSHLTAWRKARRAGSLKGLTPKRRGRKPTRRNPLSRPKWPGSTSSLPRRKRSWKFREKLRGCWG